MNYQDLSLIIPLPVQNWSFEQIQMWLKFINMEKLIPQFANINGYQLIHLNDKKLSQLGIKSNIMKKKLINWIQNGFSSFNHIVQNNIKKNQNNIDINQNLFLSTKNNMFNDSRSNQNIFFNPINSYNILFNNPFNVQTIVLNNHLSLINKKNIEKNLINYNNLNLILQNQQQLNKENISPNIPNLQRIKTKKQSSQMLQIQMTISRKNNQLLQNQPINNNNSYGITNNNINSTKLRITNYQGHQNAYFLVDHNGIKIGRNPSNQIKSLQVSVQGHHASIIKSHKSFLIIDEGTKSGTFIKINHKVQLVKGLLIQMGSFNFEVLSTNSVTKCVKLKCISVQLSAIQQININLLSKATFSFGRKSTNEFYRDDKHLSGHHAKIFQLKGKFILQDMSSTNGSWIRLRPPGIKSVPYKLQDGSIFKIGNTITYLCKYENQNKIQIQQEDPYLCTKCNTNDRNILFLPCKHTTTCQYCCHQFVKCPLCFYDIEEKIKIFI